MTAVTNSDKAATAPGAIAKEAVWPGIQLAQQAWDYWTASEPEQKD